MSRNSAKIGINRRFFVYLFLATNFKFSINKFEVGNPKFCFIPRLYQQKYEIYSSSLYSCKYSGVSLSRTCAISNIALSRTKTSVPSAFEPSLGKICLAISNFAISNFLQSQFFFGPLRQITIFILPKRKIT